MSIPDEKRDSTVPFDDNQAIPGAGNPPSDATFIPVRTDTAEQSTIAHVPTDPAREQLTVSSRLGPYRLISKLGEGGMGAVYKAVHEHLDKVVAVKVLGGNFTQNGDSVARFKREMKAVGKLEHPNIVRAMDAGEIEGTHYLAMEFVDGIDLLKLVTDTGPLTLPKACDAVRQAAQALAAAHSAGLIHRDIKPSNLLITKDGQVKLLDLGLARLGDSTQATQLTMSGQPFGTPDYMAPEQWEDSRTADHRADLYALGCTLFFLLTGRAPFDMGRHTSVANKMKGHLIDALPDLKAIIPGIPGGVDAIYQKLCAKKPADRYQTSEEVAQALLPFAPAGNQSGSSLNLAVGPTTLPASTSGPKRNVVLAAIALVAVALFAVAIVWSSRHKDGTRLTNNSPATANSKPATTATAPPVATVKEPETGAAPTIIVDSKNDDPTEWISLFNGKDMTGWSAWRKEQKDSKEWIPNGQFGWHVEDGSLCNEGNDHTLNCLATDQNDFENFQIRAEFQVNPDGNSGLWLLDTMTAEKIVNVQISNENDDCTGSVGTKIAGKVLSRRHHLLSGDQVYTLEAIVDGDRVATKLDGELLIDGYIPRSKSRIGRIVVEDHVGSKVRFRKLEVRRLSPGMKQPWIDNSLGMRLGYLPKGQLLRTDGTALQIPNPLLMGICEVRASEFSRLIRTRSRKASSSNDDAYPIDNISRIDTQRFCEALSALPAETAAGRYYRLPTTEEWEYACRSGAVDRVFFSEVRKLSPRIGWFATNAGGKSHPVAMLGSNTWGFYDMLGNVNEWTSADTIGKEDVPYAVVRGGSFLDPPLTDRIAGVPQNPREGYRTTGFRVICESPETAIMQNDLLAPDILGRVVAIWILEHGGELVIYEEGHKEVKSMQALDKGPATIIEISLHDRPSFHDEDVKYLRRDPNVETIDLKNTPITDAALYELQMFPRLHFLNLAGTQVTDKGIAEFRAARPDCEVER